MLNHLFFTFNFAIADERRERVKSKDFPENQEKSARAIEDFGNVLFIRTHIDNLCLFRDTQKYEKITLRLYCKQNISGMFEIKTFSFVIR